MVDELSSLFRPVDNFQRHSDVRSVLVYGQKDSVPNPYLTIAIPTYARPALLREAIDSALNQAQANCEYEVIVVDNEPSAGSETERLVKSYVDERLLYYRNDENIGMFGNLNRCIELARGKWVALLHDDDTLVPNYIRSIRRIIARRSDIAAVSMRYRTLLEGQEQRTNRSSIKERVEQYARSHSRIVRLTTTDCHLLGTNIFGSPTCGTLFRRDYAIEAGGFNEDLFPSSDWFFMYQLSRKYKVYKSLATMGYYRVHANESLNPSTIRRFVTQAAQFREFCRTHSLLGALMHRVFRYEQHAVCLDWALGYDLSSSIRPDEFDDLCEYKRRPMRLSVYRKMIALHWYLKVAWALIFG